MRYVDRTEYRGRCGSLDLVSFRVTIRETDLLVMADRDLSAEAYDRVLRHRLALEEYIEAHPRFRDSFLPVSVPVAAPRVVRLMADAAEAAGVGPMAAVAGAIADCLGEELASSSESVIIENGGDLFLLSPQPRTVGVFAGGDTAPMQLAIKVQPWPRALGVCTSSGVIGPSHSDGTARVATVVAGSSAVADAAATALGNRLRRTDDLADALAWVGTLPGVIGALAIHGSTMAAWGGIELVTLAKGDRRP